MISLGNNAVLRQPVGDLFRISYRQGVDDPGSRQRAYHLRQPGQTRGLIGQHQRLQAQAIAPQLTALDLNIADLLLNIDNNPIIGRCRGAKHWGVGG